MRSKESKNFLIFAMLSMRRIYIDIAHSQESVNDLILYDLSEEASFLFGEDVEKHILSIAEHQIDSQVEYGIVDDWFLNPFKKLPTIKMTLSINKKILKKKNDIVNN